jgi:FixJ family two-component response regulator
MSGTEVLAGLLLLNPNANVISASGYLEPEVEREALNIGAHDFLAKPYRIEELLTKVNRALQTRARPIS